MSTESEPISVPEPSLVYKVWKAHNTDHDEICKIAKTSKYTSAYSNRLMFSSKLAYEKGFIRIAQDSLSGTIYGFTCRRDLKRKDHTVLYFIGVAPEYRSKGVGEQLLADLFEHSPTGRVRLHVAKDNRAVDFYNKHGFTTLLEEETSYGPAYVMEKVGWLSSLPTVTPDPSLPTS